MIEEGKLKNLILLIKQYIRNLSRSMLLGRSNEIYEEPRIILKKLTGNLRRNASEQKALHYCLWSRWAQMFKEAEKGDKEVFIERTEDALKN